MKMLKRGVGSELQGLTVFERREGGGDFGAYLELPVPRDTAMELSTSRPSDGLVDSVMRRPRDLASRSAFTRLTVLVVIWTRTQQQLLRDSA